MAQKKNDKKGSGYISHGTVTENRRARYDYEIIDTVEAGMMLMGTEVKSLRKGQANLQEAYAGEKDGGIWLLGCTIAEWEGGNRMNHEPRRNRQLLLKKREIAKLLASTQQKGMTLVPLKIYFNERGLAKCLIGIAKGKRAHEKRDTIKDREWEREKERVLKDKW